MKLISVIIPCYNVEQYVSQCLISVIHQTYSNLEIICINDGSTDNTLSILNTFANKDKRIIVLDQENKGVSFSRNRGLLNSIGDFIMFVDADDWLEADTLMSLFQYYRDEDIILFSYLREFRSGSLGKDLLFEGIYDSDFIQRRLLGPLQEEKKALHSIDSLAPACCKIYSRNIMMNGVLFKHLNEIGTWEDGFFNIEILNNCHKVLVVNKPFYHYRKFNATSITSTYKKNLQQKWIIKFKLLESFLTKHQKDESFFIALNNRICITFLGLCLNEINSDHSFFSINQKINQLLKDDFYKKAFNKFDLRFLPLHWKLFYYFVQVKFSFGVTTMAFIIHSLINRKN